MTDHSMHEHGGHDHAPTTVPGPDNAWQRRARWVFWAFVTIAAGYLIAEHRAHLTGALPFLIILACPLLHMFMHGNHGGHGGHTGHGDSRRNPDRDGEGA